MLSGEVNDQPVDAAVDLVRQDHAASADGLPSVTPDVVEQELADQLDNVVPTRGYGLTPTIGLGGSAGGIQALCMFFDAMPADSGLVFVVVLHLSPEHDSTLAALLARHTAMRVQQAEDGMKVEPDQVYVIPPRKHLTMTDGHLRLTDLEHSRGTRVAVDLFFRSLADTHGPHATAIVLSGGDSDGSIGIRRVKERGCLTIAQDPAEAEQDGMPRSSITEHARTLPYPPQIQIFGCDLDEQAIQTSRAGLYPLCIAADVSQERLERFFLKTPQGYQVRRELRETVLFTRHDLLKDAPFSRMELVSCRNLLIYLDREAQARALEVFHFALRPEGLLFLGSAESINEEQALFNVVDKKHCLFLRRTNSQAGLPMPVGTSTLMRALQTQASEEKFRTLFESLDEGFCVVQVLFDEAGLGLPSPRQWWRRTAALCALAAPDSARGRPSR